MRRVGLSEGGEQMREGGVGAALGCEGCARVALRVGPLCKTKWKGWRGSEQRRAAA